MPAIALASSSFAWPRGWMVVALVYFAQVGVGLWLARINPVLFRERTTIPTAPLKQDQKATGILFGSVFIYFFLAALDAHIWQVLPQDGEITPILRGLFLYMCGIALIVWTFSKSPFARPTAQVDLAKEQCVDTCGPYALIRHPMYLGLMMCIAGLSLILGSKLFAFIAIPLVFLGFLPLMRTEETELCESVKGYTNYTQRVRCRLFPWIY
ncbi:Isoprenylcysteine carboxyl methyltransferase (ICMT) family protein [Pseudovibrio axinellae]|uniref:Isoprenylcysteine carboxyl methyltransferase (ICMT) family protein n=1 Tax=Pseudovibrio axinellae TaxID=989403 RepID=A0A161VC49_9HYPH|nr:isoprenylcysteine carboxylmethyltransferase family protein [Pseudovibrio axinellae]KZL21735.1 Isoprenylcysteine carboxyl methyltransferase (ICMT) family protein [Pseudovibrio axinellae]SEQ21413.1 Phospholipid methyltransferase [Pseudovibrio axinellae]